MFSVSVPPELAAIAKVKFGAFTGTVLPFHSTDRI
jgi:hypothetical protein